MAVIDEIGATILPNIYITNIDISETLEEYSINIKMSLKDTVDNYKAQWFKKPIQKYIYINLVAISTTYDSDESSSRQIEINNINAGKTSVIDVKPSSNKFVQTIPLSFIKDVTTSFHINPEGIKIYDFYID